MAPVGSRRRPGSGPGSSSRGARLWSYGWRLAIATCAYGLLLGSVVRELSPSGLTVKAAVWAAVIAAVVAAPLWVWLLVARSRLAAPVALGLDVMMIVVYALSRWQPRTMTPPQWDWILVYGCAAATTVIVGLSFDRRIHQRHDSAIPRSHLTAAQASIVGMVVLMGCGLLLGTLDRGMPGSPPLGVNAKPEEIGTMADGLLLSGVHRACGSSGYCDLELSITSGANLTSEEIIGLLRRQLKDNGWRYEGLFGDTFAYRMPMGGILGWHDHSLRARFVDSTVVMNVYS
jgi:hypothetical protein